MFTSKEKEKIKEYYNAVQKRIKEKHINCFKGHEKPVFLISDTYPGVWLEHAYDSLFYAKLDNKYLDIAKNTLNLFLDRQKENGQLPCFVGSCKFYSFHFCHQFQLEPFFFQHIHCLLVIDRNHKVLI
mgnify:CR=1 FL=1